MSTRQPSLAVPDVADLDRPIIYKAYEFAKPSPGEEFVLVREYRTLYYLDGQISHEVILMANPFEQLVQAFQGYFRQSGQRLVGIFDAPDKAEACARKIDHLYGKAVEISGNEIIMVM